MTFQYTSKSAGGAGTQGPAGPAGPAGSSVRLLGSFNYFGDMDVTVTNASIGDTYVVLLASPESFAGNLWTWNGIGWTNAGQILGPEGPAGPTGPQGPQGITVQGALDNLTDVTITGTPEDRQLIVYNTATSQWINANPIDSTGIAYKSGVPATPTSTGQVGQLAIDGVNAVLYVCTSTNNWQKVSLNAANFTNAGGFA